PARQSGNRRDQRSHRRGVHGLHAQVRFHPRPVQRHGRSQGRQTRRERQGHPRLRRKESGRSQMERRRRRFRNRIHGPFHHGGKRPGASRRRRQEGDHFRPFRRRS